MGRGDDEQTLEKVEWLHMQRQLQHRLMQAEKDLCHARVNDDVRRELELLLKESRAQEADRSQYQYKNKQELTALRQGVINAEALVSLVRRGVDSGATLQSALEDLEQAVHTFKMRRRQEYEELLADERLTNRELDVSVHHMESWDSEESTAGADVNRTHAASKRPTSRHRGRSSTRDRADVQGNDDSKAPHVQHDSIDAQVQAINTRIMREGGLTGGWHPKEQEIFLQLWTQVNGKSQQAHQDGTDSLDVDEDALNALLDRSAAVLRERSETEVADHLRWYLRYQQLLSEKRELVQQWREQKNRHKQEALRRDEETAKEQEGSGRANGSGKCGRVDSASEKEREKRKKMVQAWRQEKLDREAKQKEEESLRKQDEDNEREERERRRVASMRQRVDLYKLEKEHERRAAEEMQKQLQHQARAAQGGDGDGSKSPHDDMYTPRVDLSARARETLEKAKQRRNQIAQKAPDRQRQERLEKQQKMLEAIHNTPRSESNESGEVPRRSRYVYRDPERVVRPTSASKVRQYSEKELVEREKHRVTAGAHDRPVAMMPRDSMWVGKATPSWRSGLAGIV